MTESRDLEARGQAIQGERELTASDAEIDVLVTRYQDWLARAIAAVPTELQDRLRQEYEGSWHSRKIKHFFEAPGEVSVLHRRGDASADLSAFPYWQTPYDTAFRGPLLAQRQVLAEAQQLILGAGHNEDIEMVMRICRGFSEFLVPLEQRQRGRAPFVIEDEYDVQDALHGLLRVFFDDIRPEDVSPHRGGASSRIDFILKAARIAVEVKMTRANLGAGKIGEQLIVDIERYRSHPECDALVALVYDPDRYITNRRSLETDLSGERDGLSVTVIVAQ
jgi:hypothetical protein